MSQETDDKRNDERQVLVIGPYPLSQWKKMMDDSPLCRALSKCKPTPESEWLRERK